MRALRRIDQALHAISLGRAGRRRAAPLAGIDEAAHQPRHRGDAGIGEPVVVRFLNADRFQRAIAVARELEFEAAEVIGGGVGQDEGTGLAMELDVMTGAEKRRAAQLQTPPAPDAKASASTMLPSASLSGNLNIRAVRPAIGPQSHSRL